MKEIIQGAEASSIFCRMNMNLRKDIPIRSSEMGLLIFITKTNEEITSIKAAQFFMVSKPAIATMVSSLESKGYLKRVPSKVDRRSFTLVTTESGKELVEKTYNEFFKLQEILKNGMGDEDYLQFVKLLEEANSILLKEK